MKHHIATILANTPIGAMYHRLVFEWPNDHAPLPGQFVTIRAGETTAPLLRRPFAFSGFDPARGVAEIIFERRGAATAMLAGKAINDTLDCIGPLGNSFAIPERHEPLCIVAGGIGLGPMLYCAVHTAARRETAPLIFGARTKDRVPDVPEFAALAAVVCTDDGSLGYKGTVVDYLNAASPMPPFHLYCCGPKPMLKACHDYAVAHGGMCRVSMEQVMACGVGACMGCTVKTTRGAGYARVCADGPVFDSREIAWT